MFKNFFSVVLKAMVDAKYRFIWGSSCFPGNFHDVIIFHAKKTLGKDNFIPNIG